MADASASLVPASVADLTPPATAEQPPQPQPPPSARSAVLSAASSLPTAPPTAQPSEVSPPDPSAMEPPAAAANEVRLHLEPAAQHEQGRGSSSLANADGAAPPSSAPPSAQQLSHARDEDKVLELSANGHKRADYFHSGADDKNAWLGSSWKAPTVIRRRNEAKDGWRTTLTARWKQSWLYEVTSTGHEDACAFECSSGSGPRGAMWPPLYPPSALAARPALRLHRFYTFYVRPGFYLLASLLLSLYFFVVMNSIATWRTNAQADRHGYLPVTPGIDPKVPADRQLPSSQIFILSDLMHELIPAASGSSYIAWDIFVDLSLALMIAGTVLLGLLQRDLMRLAEWVSIEVILFVLNGFLHVLTVYPDPWGSNGSCQDAGKRAYGAWIFGSLQFEYCGDSLFSGHTFNFVVACIMLRRLTYEWIGWDSLPWTCLTHSTASYSRQLDAVSALHVGPDGTADVLKKQIRMAGYGDGFHTRNARVLTKHLDSSSLLGVDTVGSEALEFTEPKPIGGSQMLVERLAEQEGAGRERALELAALMRMPVHALIAGPGEGVGIDVEMKIKHQTNPHAGNNLATAADVAAAAASSNADAARGSEGKSLAPSSSAAPSQHPSFGSSASLPAGRVVQVYNGPLFDTPMGSLSSMRALEEDYAAFAMASDPTVPRALPSAPFQLTAPIPSAHGGAGVGGHYGAPEGNINLGHFPATASSAALAASKDQGHSALPCPEWDDARAHGMNSFFRYRANGLCAERIVVSRAPPPYFVRAHPRASWWVLNLLRFALLCYTVVFLVGIFRVRYHYGTDVFVAIFFAIAVACNDKVLQVVVRFMYRPVDARYADAPAYPFAMHPQHYQDTLSKIGVGGLF